MNLAWEKSFFWDGGVDHLDLFAPNPIASPVEMGSSLSQALGRLRGKAGYKALFKEAFGDSAITTDRLLKALSQFQLMCISADSKYDRVLLGMPGVAFTLQELAGKQLFEAKCARCHSGVLFTDGLFHANGLNMNAAEDSGRYRITHNAAHLFQFKTPSLRNVAFTYPYMHDGRFATLPDVLNHYSSGVAQEPYVDADLRATKGIPLSDTEKSNIIAFLRTLSDTTFITNPLLAVPKTLP
jgi:cytochrome c peroxidase